MAAESGALVGNQNPEADAEAAHGPDPLTRKDPSRQTPNSTANGDSAPANGNSDHAEDMENGEVGKGSQNQSNG